jgi:hypothetical protein
VSQSAREIPPELAEAAAEQIEDVLLWGMITENADNPLARLKPYLARIAGRHQPLVYGRDWDYS